MRIQVCLWLVLLLLSVEARSEIVRGSNVRLIRRDMTSAAMGDLQFDFHVPTGPSETTLFHSLFLSEPDLAVKTFTIGSEFVIFGADNGDVLNQLNITSFGSFAVPGGMTDFGKLDVPLGVSYVGFGIREPVENADWHTIGWLQLSRDEDGLMMLDNAVNHSDTTLQGGLGASSGIVVGVPEPDGLTLLLVVLSCLFLARPRNRRS